MSNFIIAIASGLVTGLISNYLADVLPRNRKLTWPVCLDCGENREISKFLTGSACDYCSSDRRIRFFIVLFVCIFMCFGVQIYPIENLPFSASLILIIFFTTIIITDIEFKVILEQMSVVGGVIGIIVGWYLHGIKATILGGVSGFLLFLVLYYLGKLLPGKCLKTEKNKWKRKPSDLGMFTSRVSSAFSPVFHLFLLHYLLPYYLEE